eukprot:scaffold88703_cov29-Tisochrysis_lutea.AAC.2
MRSSSRLGIVARMRHETASRIRTACRGGDGGRRCLIASTWEWRRHRRNVGLPPSSAPVRAFR